MRRCPINGCGSTKRSHELFCRKHWFMVPRAMRDEIWTLYRTNPGSDAHRAMCFEAIRYVNDRSGVS